MELADNNKSRDNMSTNTNDRSTMNLQQKLMEHGEDHMRIDRKLDNMNAINEDTYQKGTEALSNLQKQGKQIDGINEKMDEIKYKSHMVDNKTQQMRNRQFYMNLLLYFVALALFISIIVILGIKISKKIN